MIKLTVDGACRECHARALKVFESPYGAIVRCEHQSVCKYIEEEKNTRMDDTTTQKKTP